MYTDTLWYSASHVLTPQVGTQEEGCSADDVNCGYRLCYCPGIHNCNSASWERRFVVLLRLQLHSSSLAIVRIFRYQRLFLHSCCRTDAPWYTEKSDFMDNLYTHWGREIQETKNFVTAQWPLFTYPSRTTRTKCKILQDVLQVSKTYISTNAQRIQPYSADLNCRSIEGDRVNSWDWNRQLLWSWAANDFGLFGLGCAWVQFSANDFGIRHSCWSALFPVNLGCQLPLFGVAGGLCVWRQFEIFRVPHFHFWTTQEVWFVAS